MSFSALAAAASARHMRRRIGATCTFNGQDDVAALTPGDASLIGVASFTPGKRATCN
jgi:hypothetical protein